jgi:ABC-type dipeptide/oligopeptide/nickel transport system ATPase component
LEWPFSYISHDLASVAGICDRIAILHQGEIVECGTTEQVFSRPQHDYTQRLIAALPRILPAGSAPPTKAEAAGAR